jgi:hypothetical protein
LITGLIAGLGLSMATGCQTWLGGQTLPSPYYLDDRPDYIPRSGQFPLPRELAAQQAAAANLAPAAGAPGAPVAPPP